MSLVDNAAAVAAAPAAAGWGWAAEQLGSWSSTIQSGFRGSGIGAQILGGVAVDDKLAMLLDGFVRHAVIPAWRLDDLVRGAVAHALGGTAKTVLSVLEWIDRIGKVWHSFPEVVRTTLVFMIGRVGQILENWCGWILRSFKQQFTRVLVHEQGSIEPVNTHAFVGVFERLATLDTSQFFAGLNKWMVQIRLLAGATAASLAWDTWGLAVSRIVVAQGWAVGSYVSDWFRGSSKPVPEAPAQEERAEPAKPGLGGKTDFKKPELPRVQIGPMALVAREFRIQPSTAEKLGGLSVQADLEFAMLEDSTTVDATRLGGGALINWDAKFEWHAKLENLPLLERARLGFLSLENLKLQELDAEKDNLSLAFTVSKLRVGDFLEVRDGVRVAWSSKTGASLQATGVALELPEPLSTVSGSLDFGITRDARLDHLRITDFKAGANFTVAEASYEKDDFRIRNARYSLPEAKLGPDAWIELAELQIDSKGGIKRADGSFSVSELELFGPDSGVRVGGTASVGYDREHGFLCDLADGFLSIQGRGVSGAVRLGKTMFVPKTGEIAGSLASANFQAGPLMVSIEGGLIAKERAKDGTRRILQADGAEVMFGTDAAKLGHKNQADFPGLGSFLGGLRGSELATVRAEGLRYVVGEGLSWDSLSARVGLPPRAKVSLFGGMITGAYDTEKREAEIGAHLAYPSGRTSLLDGLEAEVHIVPGLGVFVGAGVTGGIGVDVTGKVKGESQAEGGGQDRERLALALLAQAHGHLGVRLTGGFFAGTRAAVAARGYLEGRAGLHASTKAAVYGTIEKRDGSYEHVGGRVAGAGSHRVLMEFNFDANLTADVSVVMDVVALMVLTRQLYRHKLKTWELGKFHFEGYIHEEDGKLKHVITKPDKKKVNRKDPTFGGAFEQPVRIDPRALEPIPVSDAIRMLADRSETVTDHRLMNRLVTQVIDDDGLTTREKAELLRQLGCVSRVESNLLDGYAEDARGYLRKRDVLPGLTSQIMTEEQWRSFSTTARRLSVLGDSTRSERTRRIDEAVKAYHEIRVDPTGKPAQVEAELRELLAHLDELRKPCLDYLKSPASRFEMVRYLLSAIDREERLLEEHIAFQRLKQVGSQEAVDASAV